MMTSEFGKIVTVESWGGTRQGRTRTENQDAFLNWPERLLWCVADGVGGCMHGAWASRLLVKRLMGVPSPLSLNTHISNVTRTLAYCNAEMRLVPGGAASTAVVLLFHAGYAACLWSGDCRCYLLRAGVLHQCSRDHTLRQQTVERGLLTGHEALRMVPGNVVTEAIGARDEMTVETASFSLQRGDRFLLCSDGLSDHLSQDALMANLRAPNARHAAENFTAALDESSPWDDATFVCVSLSGG